MRRLAALAAAIAFVAGGCSDGETKDASRTTERPTVTSARTVAPAVTTADCPGIGTVPNKPQITVVHGDGLYALGDDGLERCLVRGDTPRARWATWAPTGNRVLFNGKVHYSSGRASTAAPELSVIWSRPRGTSFVGLNDGCLQKWSAEGGDRTAAGFGDCGIDSFAYHPAGKHISVGAQGPDGYGIYIATNTGEGMRLVTRGESATKITEMSFSQDGERLYFVAVHEGQGHVHQLDLNTAKIETLAAASQIQDLHVSAIGGVAWTEGECGESHVVVRRNGRDVAIPDELKRTRVVGWTDPNTIVFSQVRCSTTPPPIYRWSAGHAVETVATEVFDAAIRAPLPPAPGPPPRTVFDIPESKAPA